MIDSFVIFHLNLAYSSIPTQDRKKVIEHCYFPLLELLETNKIVAGIELSGWTLQQISELAPEWLTRFRGMLQSGCCELIGSGHAQIIGPLVPFEVNVWNQRLGLEDYDNILGIRPNLALVNELAYSSGLATVYREAGYKGIIMDRDNVALALGLSNNDTTMPSNADCGNGRGIPVLWIDSILFQKFQRYAHGDNDISDYLDYFRKRAEKQLGPLAIYGNDAEIFDYRPGRFKNETKIEQSGEWRRIGQLLSTLQDQENMVLLTPTAALLKKYPNNISIPVKLTSASQPIPVKKQAKYNISRWAITGRDDLWINTLCYRIYQEIQQVANDFNEWRDLCQLWASDLRTHITPSRWNDVIRSAEEFKRLFNFQDPTLNSLSFPSQGQVDKEIGGLACCQIDLDPESIYMVIETETVKIVLNKRRGLTIHSLSFKQHAFTPLIGTLPLGYFSSIELGADFYSGGVIIERLRDHSRCTDLSRVEPEIIQQGDKCIIKTKISSDAGDIVKVICISKKRQLVSLHYDFPGWERPYGSVRVGNFTFLSENFDSSLFYQCRNGGPDKEMFELTVDTLHTQPASSLVSASAGLGATDGEITIGDQNKMLRFKWDPGLCAAFPMIYHKQSQPNSLTRLVFSLSELDETRVEGGTLLPLSIEIEPV